jgi:hypothetical protein
MLYLVTGQPGNGKTLRAMALMVEEYERNAAAVKAGKEQPRRFFSNIKGSYRDDPEAPNPHAFDWVEPLPDHRDWTLLPEGSFVVYDEAHADGKTRGLERYGHLFPATGKPGESDDPRIRAMSTHRHGGYDLVLVTQYPNKVHHQVRKLVGTHIHMTRAMGLAAAGMMTWARCQEDPYDERQREKAEEEIWQFPKDLYRRYVSATLHTAGHKFRLPKKVKNGLITGITLLLMLAGFWWFMGWDLSTLTGGGGQPQAEASAASPAAAPSVFNPSTFEDSGPVLAQGMGTFIALQTEPAPTLMGCVSSDRGCRCFNSDGFQIDMSQTQCQDVIARPLPFNVAHRYQRPSREDRADNRAQGGAVEPLPGNSGGGVGTAPAPAVDASFGTITRGLSHGS